MSAGRRLSLASRLLHKLARAARGPRPVRMPTITTQSMHRTCLPTVYDLQTDYLPYLIVQDCNDSSWSPLLYVVLDSICTRYLSATPIFFHIGGSKTDPPGCTGHHSSMICLGRPPLLVLKGVTVICGGII